MNDDPLAKFVAEMRRADDHLAVLINLAASDDPALGDRAAANPTEKIGFGVPLDVSESVGWLVSMVTAHHEALTALAEHLTGQDVTDQP